MPHSHGLIWTEMYRFLILLLSVWSERAFVWSLWELNKIDFSVAKATLQSPMSVRSSVCLSSKPLNSLKSSSFIIHLSSFIILHSSFIILHSYFLHFATFKLFSLFYWTWQRGALWAPPLENVLWLLLWVQKRLKNNSKISNFQITSKMFLDIVGVITTSK